MTIPPDRRDWRQTLRLVSAESRGFLHLISPWRQPQFAGSYNMVVESPKALPYLFSYLRLTANEQYSQKIVSDVPAAICRFR